MRYWTENGTSPSANITRVQPTSWPPLRKAISPMGTPRLRKISATGTSAATASRIAFVNSTRNPATSLLTAIRDNEGSIAVASPTVIRECGSTHSRLALLYAVSPAPEPPAVAEVASLVTTISATWLTATNPSVHLASWNVWPRPVWRRSKRGLYVNPTRRMNGTRTSVWTAMPSTDPRPSSSTWPVVKGWLVSV